VAYSTAVPTLTLTSKSTFTLYRVVGIGWVAIIAVRVVRIAGRRWALTPRTALAVVLLLILAVCLLVVLLTLLSVALVTMLEAALLRWTVGALLLVSLAVLWRGWCAVALLLLWVAAVAGLVVAALLLAVPLLAVATLLATVAALVVSVVTRHCACCRYARRCEKMGRRGIYRRCRLNTKTSDGRKELEEKIYLTLALTQLRITPPKEGRLTFSVAEARAASDAVGCGAHSHRWPFCRHVRSEAAQSRLGSR
jgi:hypothetical protein